MGISHRWNGTVLEITSDSGTSAADLKGAKGDKGARGARGLQGAMGGGAMIEDNVISDETTWSSNRIMDNFAEAMSVSGNPVSCMPIPNYPLHIITNIEPKQEGSGEPYPAGGGKSLVSFKDLIGYNYTTFSTAVIDGQSVITIDTSTSDYEWATCGTNKLYFPAAGTYTFSAYIYAPTAATCRISILDETYATVSNKEQKVPAGWTRIYTTLTDANVNDKYMFCIRTLVSENIDISFNRCMVESGNTPTEYQPYSNIRPISGMGEVNVTRCGKNILKPEWQILADGGIKHTIENDGSITLNGTATANHFLLALPKVANSTITISVDKELTQGVYIYPGNEKYASIGSITPGNKNVTIKNDGIYSIRICVLSGTTLNNYNLKIQMEIGIATAYEPYKGNTYTMYLPETIYGGSIDWSKGELVAEWAMKAFDGTEAWWIAPCEKGYCARLPQAGQGIGAIGSSCASSHYPIKTPDEIYANPVLGISYSVTGQYVALADNRIIVSADSLDDFKSYLAEQYAAGTPVQVAYKLAEPYTIQLTEQEIKAIKDTNTLFTDADNIQVIGRVDTMYQLSQLNARIAALEAALINA